MPALLTFSGDTNWAEVRMKLSQAIVKDAVADVIKDCLDTGFFEGVLLQIASRVLDDRVAWRTFQAQPQPHHTRVQLRQVGTITKRCPVVTPVFPGSAATHAPYQNKRRVTNACEETDGTERVGKSASHVVGVNLDYSVKTQEEGGNESYRLSKDKAPRKIVAARNMAVPVKKKNKPVRESESDIDVTPKVLYVVQNHRDTAFRLSARTGRDVGSSPGLVASSYPTRIGD
ncbi:hypothetical protein ST47_g10551 [Ascochyta rabiei]|uniref:Uncharacterized protein n=1 Tax=Didymella rabiei TaxID=5454 RepID=A0A162V7W1_DIDRA|nr:hypothetical protein ST47_g10551 [Ascochyta rabiei]